MWVFATFLLLLQTAATSKDNGPVVEYKIGPLILVGAVLAVLGFLFWIMLSYSNRVAETGPLGAQVKDALYTLREQQVVKALSEKWDRKAYHQDTANDQIWLAAHPVAEVPETLKGDYAVEAARTQALERGWVGTLAPGFGTRDQTTGYLEQRSQYIGLLRKWEDTLNQEARRRYRKEEHDLLNTARLETGNKAFDAFDFASLGDRALNLFCSSRPWLRSSSLLLPWASSSESGRTKPGLSWPRSPDMCWDRPRPAGPDSRTLRRRDYQQHRMVNV
jgi:hypothetical protein